MTLPRTIWCHVDYRGDAGDVELGDITTVVSSVAVEWVRESVRILSAGMDRTTFRTTWGWLGDHRAVRADLAELGRGRPYDFAARTTAGQWAWSAHAVAVLPMVEDCCHVPRRKKASSAPV